MEMDKNNYKENEKYFTQHLRTRIKESEPGFGDKVKSFFKDFLKSIWKGIGDTVFTVLHPIKSREMEKYNEEKEKKEDNKYYNNIGNEDALSNEFTNKIVLSELPNLQKVIELGKEANVLGLIIHADTKFGELQFRPDGAGNVNVWHAKKIFDEKGNLDTNNMVFDKVGSMSIGNGKKKDICVEKAIDGVVSILAEEKGFFVNKEPEQSKEAKLDTKEQKKEIRKTIDKQFGEPETQASKIFHVMYSGLRYFIEESKNVPAETYINNLYKNIQEFRQDMEYLSRPKVFKQLTPLEQKSLYSAATSELAKSIEQEIKRSISDIKHADETHKIGDKSADKEISVYVQLKNIESAMADLGEDKVRKMYHGEDGYEAAYLPVDTAIRNLESYIIGVAEERTKSSQVTPDDIMNIQDMTGYIFVPEVERYDSSIKDMQKELFPMRGDKKTVVKDPKKTGEPENEKKHDEQEETPDMESGDGYQNGTMSDEELEAYCRQYEEEEQQSDMQEDIIDKYFNGDPEVYAEPENEPENTSDTVPVEPDTNTQNKEESPDLNPVFDKTEKMDETKSMDDFIKEVKDSQEKAKGKTPVKDDDVPTVDLT